MFNGIGMIPSGGTSKKTIKTIVEQRTYGANLRRFIKKARDWRSGKRFAQPPQIVMIGDSITGGSWAEEFKTWLCAAYNIQLEFFEIHWYGGYCIERLLPFIEDVLIFPNPDLILFGEYEDPGNTNERLMIIENIISLIRDRTTADIGIYTWSMTDTIATDYVTDASTLIDNSQYQDFNWYRDIAATYNCELIDFNQALKNALDAGGSVDSIWSDGPHLSTAGYDSVFLPEIKKHFPVSDDQLALNMPYPLRGKEEMIYLDQTKRMDLFSGAEKITATGTWTDMDGLLTSTVAGNTVEVELTDITGLEILHGDLANADIAIKPAGGTYAAPSTLQLNGRPLQYCTEITSVTYADNWDNWRLKRPFMKGTVETNILADTYIKSGRYTIKVISLGPDTCEMFDPDGVSLGTFVVGAAFNPTGGLNFPAIYNGEENYIAQAAFVVDDLYEFYICNNWCDQLSAGLSPELTDGVEPATLTVIDSDDFTSYDPITRLYRLKYTSALADIKWNGVVDGVDYVEASDGTVNLQFAYEEVTKIGTGDIKISSPNVTLSGYTEAEGECATNYMMLYRVGNGPVDVTFRLSTKAIGPFGYEDTKKIYGLPRGDYTLKITATTGGVDLAAVKALH